MPLKKLTDGKPGKQSIYSSHTGVHNLNRREIMTNDNTVKEKIPFIGLLAIKTQFITKNELKKALSKCCGADNQNIALKEYFLSNGLISSRKMKKLLLAVKKLSLRQMEIRFGTIAIKKKFINQTDLQLIFKEQKNNIRNKKKVVSIGDMLVKAGMLTMEQRDYILKLQKQAKRKTENTVKRNGAQTMEKQTLGTPKNLPDNTKKEVVLLKPEIIAGGIKFAVYSNFMTAVLTKTDCFDQNITVAQVKQALLDKDIRAGIVADEMIEGFIKSSGFKTKAFKIAQGITPIHGKDAKIKFYFDRDYLKAGGLTEDGIIDFKERGEMPFVELGALLAEKTPMKESQNGKNIYGDEVEIPPATDIELKFGTGAQLSEDGLKVLAEVQGFPVHTMSGHIAVYQEYTTEGDVDYETGHINYDGNVNVNGRIKSGFKVKGNNIQAMALDGGIITADENVNIAGGINEGTIYSRGSVHAKFIHKSKLLCLGDVIIEKEIVDADIECSGRCVVENGKLISSRITAKMGVQAKNIGTDMSEPNIIKVGHDIFSKRELEKNRKAMNKLKEKIEYYFENRERLKEENSNLENQITELAHVQDRAQLEEKNISSKIILLEKDGTDTQAIDGHKKKIDLLKMDAQKAEEDLNTCFEKSDEIEKIMENQEKEINDLEKTQDDLMTEESNLLAWAKDNPGKPVVIAQGSIFSGTIIKGLHCEKRIGELISYTKIMEIQFTCEDGLKQNIYEMQIGSI